MAPTSQHVSLRANLTKGLDADGVTLEHALELLAAKAAKGAGKGRRRGTSAKGAARGKAKGAAARD